MTPIQSTVLTSCTHCAEWVPVPSSFDVPSPLCPECGHRPDVGRLWCDCPSCEQARELEASPGPAPRTHHMVTLRIAAFEELEIDVPEFEFERFTERLEYPQIFQADTAAVMGGAM